MSYGSMIGEELRVVRSLSVSVSLSLFSRVFIDLLNFLNAKSRANYVKVRVRESLRS